MPKLTRDDQARADALGVKVVFADRAMTHDWRSPEGPALYGGWYWMRGGQRQGGFHTLGAALRHALDTFAGVAVDDLAMRRARWRMRGKGASWWQRHRRQPYTPRRRRLAAA